MRTKEDKDYFQRFGFIMFPEPPESSVWFHCASVGEVRSLKTLISNLKDRFPETEIIISTTTATGKDIAEKELKPFASFLLPIENSFAIRHIIEYMNVRALVIVDTELWPNLITTASKHTQLYLVNGRISDRSMNSYRRIRFIISPLLKSFEFIFTKSGEDRDRFTELKGSSEGIEVLGNIKYYEVNLEPEDKAAAPLAGTDFFFAASTHKGEEEAALNAWIKSGKRGRVVIAPRHMNRVSEVYEEAKRAGLRVCRLTTFNENCEAVVVDLFGQLEPLYKHARKIFIGGSIADVGGHNIFEALQFGKCAAVGPNMHNFREIYSMAAKHGMVCTVHNEEEMAVFIKEDRCVPDGDAFMDELRSSAEHKLDRFLEALNESLGG
ncbi:3-deoxy-D-manno-octulosonic acid transferase [Limisalsivibrio acetivorans]|uniref:3-deoxy-D-manno-octulosonic acid transferase n=1 Tax=Limisalsivibrio acetivorans TaxID=1304888 RepID=UPI000683E7A3|nr:glycosyltransferase N-terminal domain-containing protein [Limisalsivibrio acetivorans]